MPETAIAAAMKRAGYNGDYGAAYVEVAEVVAQAGTLDAAAEILEARVRGNPIKRLQVLRLLVEFVARDQRGDELKGAGHRGHAGKADAPFPAALHQTRGAGFVPTAAKASMGVPVPSRTNDGGEAESSLPATASERVPTPPSQNASSGADAHVPQGLKAPSPEGATERDGRGFVPTAGKAVHPVPRPVAASYVSAMKANASTIARTVFDSFKVRDGRPIGDVTFGELGALLSENTREAAVVRQIMKHVSYADPSTKVRDVVKQADLERMIQRAAEVADAA